MAMPRLVFAAVIALSLTPCNALAGTHLVMPTVPSENSMASRRPQGAASDIPVSDAEAEGELVSRLQAEIEDLRQQLTEARAASNLSASDAEVLDLAAEPRLPVLDLAPKPRPPVMLHFMFLLMDQFPLPGIWAEFFRSAPPDTYTLWAHCVNQSLCERDPGMNLLNIRLVPTTYSKRGLDLVTPYVHMVRIALTEMHLAASGVMTEKFLVMSDSTLPIKPFLHVYGELAQSVDSDICLSSIDQWANGTVDGVPVALAKHHQWLALNRHDAEMLVNDWVPVLGEHDSWNIPLREGRWAGSNRTVPRSAFEGGMWYNANDEEAPFAYIHGPVELRFPGDTEKPMNLFLQRRCTTYVGFPFDVPSANESQSLLQHDPEEYATPTVTALIVQDPGNKLNVQGGAVHPFTIQALSYESTLTLRRSVFLFARKFALDADLPNFTRIVFDDA
uniref:Protein xylosyltransferase n=1 Tax=Alexandrium catenella TaxID=2925 RepID=A0A7S1RYD9_ALECA